MVDGYLNFDTKINTQGFNKGISQIGNMVKGAGETVSKLGSAFVPVTAAVTGVGAAAVKTTIDFTKLYESTMVVFEKMLGGKDAADKLYSSLLDIAKASTFSQEAFLTAGKKLVGMGVDAQSTTKYMQAITDAVAGFGGTSENLTNVAENFAKISTAGRISMEDVNMLSDNGIQALKILGNQYGVTADEMRDMISSGAVPAKEAMDLLADGIENGTDGINGMTAAMSGMAQSMKGGTLTGALDSLNTGFRNFALNLTGINPTLRETDAGYEESSQRLQQLTAAVSTISGILPQLSSLFSGLTDGIGALLDKLIGANVTFDEATGTWQNVGGVLGTIQEKLDSMDASKLESIGNVILTMAAAGAGLPILGSGLSTVGSALNSVASVITPVKDGIGGLPSVFKDTSNKLKSAGKSFGNLKDAILLPLDEIKPKMSNTLDAMSEMWRTGPGGKIASSASQTFGKVTEAFGKIGPSLQSKFPTITNTLSSFGSYMGSWGGVLGDAFQGVLSTVADFAPGFIKLLKFGAIAGAVVAGLGLLQSQFGDQITAMLQMAQTKGPELIANFCNGITAALPNLIAQGATLIQNLLAAITANIPAIVTGGVQIISGLVTGIAQQLPQLIPAALQMILTLVQALISNAPQLISAGLQLILGLAQGLVSAIPTLISAIPSIIQSLVSGIAQCLPMIILAGIQLIVTLVTGIIQAIPQLLQAIPEIFSAFVDGISSVDWLSVGKQILTAIADGIVSIGSSLWDAVKGIFSGGEEEAASEGKKAGAKYAEGVDSTTVNAQTAATNVANATTTSFSTGLTAGSFQVNAAAMGLGTSANTGLDMANVPGSFSADAQAAAAGLTTSLNNNAYGAMAAGMNVGSNANAGVNSSNMSGTYSAAGAQAGQALGTSLTGQSGTVAAAAGVVSSSASGVDLSGAYSAAGSDAMQSMAGAISSGTGTVTSAATAAANAAVQGLKTVNISSKAKTEGQNFFKSLADAIKSGVGTVRAAVTSVINAAKSAATGLGSSGQTLGSQFSAGIAAGIRSGQSSISSAAAQVAQAAVRAAQSNLQVNSPSKVGIWLGKMFDQGVAKGLKDNVSAVLSGMRIVTDTLSSGTERALQNMQRSAVTATAASGSGAYRSISGTPYQQQTDYSGILDEWERRQKKINRERDDRPIILSGRQINRTKNKKGDIKA